ncbi:MAG: hypothetical protein NZM42_15015 [Gemmatales bacterium]|nr:hypothetical protein [Gemmatales bacterium]
MDCGGWHIDITEQHCGDRLSLAASLGVLANRLINVNGVDYTESEVRRPFVPFAPPAEITFESQIADEYYFACGVDVVHQCQMLARYRNYFVYFYFDVTTQQDPGGLTYAEIERVLRALEDKVAALLNVSSVNNQ